MGGMQALKLGLRDPDQFGWIGVYSPIMEPDFEPRYPAELANAAGLNKKLRLLWVRCGSEDQLYGEPRRSTRH